MLVVLWCSIACTCTLCSMYWEPLDLDSYLEPQRLVFLDESWCS